MFSNKYCFKNCGIHFNEKLLEISQIETKKEIENIENEENFLNIKKTPPEIEKTNDSPHNNEFSMILEDNFVPKSYSPTPENNNPLKYDKIFQQKSQNIAPNS